MKIKYNVLLIIFFIALGQTSYSQIYGNKNGPIQAYNFSVQDSSCSVIIKFSLGEEFTGNISVQRSLDGINYIEAANLNANVLNYICRDINPPVSKSGSYALKLVYRLCFYSGLTGDLFSISPVRLVTLTGCTGNPSPSYNCSGTPIIFGSHNISFCDVDPNLYNGPILGISGGLPQTTNWSSSNSSIIDIDGFGELIPKQFGTVTITATQPICSKSDTFLVTLGACPDTCSSTSRAIYYNSAVTSGGLPTGISRAAYIFAGSQAGNSSGSGITTNTSSVTSKLIGSVKVDLVSGFDATATGSGLFDASIQSCTNGANDSLVPYSATLSTVTYDSSFSYSAVNSFTLIDEASVANKSSVNFYPNPVSSIMNIDFNSTANGAGYIKLVNSIGVTVLSKSVSVVDKDNLQHTTIDLSKLSRGVYLVQIIDSNGQMTTKRIEKL